MGRGAYLGSTNAARQDVLAAGGPRFLGATAVVAVLYAFAVPWLLRAVSAFALTAHGGEPSVWALAARHDRPLRGAGEVAALGVVHGVLLVAIALVLQFLVSSVAVVLLGFEVMVTRGLVPLIAAATELLAFWVWAFLVAPLLAAPFVRVELAGSAWSAMRRAWTLRMAGGWWRIGLVQEGALVIVGVVAECVGLLWLGATAGSDLGVGGSGALQSVYALVVQPPLWGAAQAVIFATTAAWYVRLDRDQRTRARALTRAGALDAAEVARLFRLSGAQAARWLGESPDAA